MTTETAAPQHESDADVSERLAAPGTYVRER
jgi:hypothetical protein